jgi:hypothetical protein
MTTRLETLVGLDLVANVATPVPAATQAFYAGLAQGTGPNGTFVVTDVLPGASGIRENPALTSALTLINSGAAAGLTTLYQQMRSVVTDGYGTPPTIVIPTGPAANTYASYDDAIQALVVASNNEIGNIRANSIAASSVAQANQDWTLMSHGWSQSGTTQSLASINLSTLPAGAQVPVTAFIGLLDSLGVDTQEGMQAQYLESVANTGNQYGQAVVACLRQGRNNAAMNTAGIGHDNAVPDQPTSEPPQANLGNANYTVSEARAYVNSNLTS